MTSPADRWQLAGTARVNRRAAARLRRGHAWVYRSDLAAGELAPGLVAVTTAEGAPLGTALSSPRSAIALRLVASAGESFDAATLAQRLEAALARRRQLFPTRDAFRVVHGEADRLPGTYVDRYADCVVVMTTCAGADLFEADVITALRDMLTPRAIVVRDDTAGRRREGLAEHVTVVHGEAPVQAVYHEGELALEVDLCADQKTGGFLDQTDNHLLAGRVAFGRALDCFTYHGGFALQMARRAETVLAVDQSAPALERARANAARNQVHNVDWRRANVFDLLKELGAAGRRFETIVLDPPALASTQETVPRALRAYRELNRRALGLLSPGGLLVTCSCSGRVRAADFDEVLRQAAHDARRPVQLVERRGAGADHPVLLEMEETEYLKCRLLLAP